MLLYEFFDIITIMWKIRILVYYVFIRRYSTNFYNNGKFPQLFFGKVVEGFELVFEIKIHQTQVPKLYLAFDIFSLR